MIKIVTDLKDVVDWTAKTIGYGKKLKRFHHSHDQKMQHQTIWHLKYGSNNPVTEDPYGRVYGSGKP